MELDNSVSTPEETASSNKKMYHRLHNNWTLWAHLPHDTDWTVKSYKKIMTFTTVEEALVLYETLPDKMIKNCMLFLMREGIKPTWEDEKNRGGGCFSYKVGNKNIITTWKHASYSLIGETLTAESKLCASINGITISPKKNFCIIKIWLGNCDFQNPQKITEVAGIVPQGCLFKKHTPQY
jgi:translation initiation factor 4E